MNWRRQVNRRTRLRLLAEKILAPIGITLIVLMGFRPRGGSVRRG